MNTLRVLVADDEAPGRARLKRLLEGLAGAQWVGEAANGLHALEEVHRLKPDLVLLDIEMPELDGLAVARAIQSGPPAVVFCTAYDQHAVKAFELAAVDYLVKPVAEERLGSALERVRQRRVTGPEALQRLSAELPQRPVSRRIAVRCGSKFAVFEIARISAVLAKDHYSAILIDGRELLSDEGLDAIGRQLDPEQFVRIHRSGIINLSFLKELHHEGDRRYTAVLADQAQTRVPVSRERLDSLRSKLTML